MKKIGPDQKITDQFASIDVHLLGGLWILGCEVIHLWIFRTGPATADGDCVKSIAYSPEKVRENIKNLTNPSIAKLDRYFEVYHLTYNL